MNTTRHYDVSTLVLTYHPDMEKLFQTLQSALLQEDIRQQIVVADDGTPNDFFPQVRSFLDDRGFHDYVLVKLPENGGTVRNLQNGLLSCEGSYVKLISPGDYLSGPHILADWIGFMQEKDLAMSGADAIYYYTDTEGHPKAVVSKANPQRVGLTGNALRDNYLLYDDLFLGAAVLCKTHVLQRYVDEIAGKVIYAEDNCLRLMLYNGEAAGFWHTDAVLYETGIGVSTGGSDKWTKRLQADWDATNTILAAWNCGDPKFQKRLNTVIQNAHLSGWRGYLSWLQTKGLLAHRLCQKLRPRLTGSNLPYEWMQKLQTCAADVTPPQP